MEYKTYKEWFKKIIWLKDKVILPNNQTVDKSRFVRKDGFDIDSFNVFLFNTYNKLYPVSDDRRCKK